MVAGEAGTVTTIAAVVGTKRVHMAADSASHYSSLLVPCQKIRRMDVGGEWVLVAGAGRAAIVPMVLAHLTIEALPKDRPDKADEWAQAVAEAITGVAMENHLHEDNTMDGFVLLAWRRHLWAVTHHLAERIDHYMAVGSGAEVAMGCLWATAGQRASERAYDAVAASIDHVSGIAGPITTDHT